MRHHASQTVVLLLFAANVVAAAHPTLDDYEPPAEGSVRIVRDVYGVPHIIARDQPSLFFGVGFAQAEDQLENIARNYLLSEGRGAEFLGRSRLPLDHLVRSLGLERLAQQGYVQLSPKIHAMLDAYSAGINAYIEQNQDRVPDWVEPTAAHDSLALALYVNALFAMEDCRRDLELAGIQLANCLPPGDEQAQWGSNQFAIEPSRSATGAAMLSMDPHLPHEGVLRWYEMHQIGPDINAMGATFFGFPLVALGRTHTTAWCQTINAPDLGDVFALQIDPGNSMQYRAANGWQTLEAKPEIYRVATPDGMEQVQQTVLNSQFGPVVGLSDNVGYTFRIALPAAHATVEQGLAILQANDLSGFRQALNCRGTSMFNFVYADRQGDTFYISNGLVPKRDTRISSHDIRPAEEAWADWQGIHALKDHPQIDNPTIGYLMNTNSGPQNVTETDTLDPDNFPPYMMRQQLNSRARRLRSLLANDTSISWDEMLAYATDTKLEAEAPLAQLGRHAAHSDDPLVIDARRVLGEWDHRTDLTSRGAVLFFYLMADADVQRALKADESSDVIVAMKRVSADVRTRFGSLDVPWKEFSRIRRGAHEVGMAGSAGIGGLVGSALRPAYGSLQDGRRYCRGGSSYGMIVDFSGQTKSVSCLPFGVSENPESPYFRNMLPLYAQRLFKPAWFLPQEVADNTESDRTLRIADFQSSRR